MAILETNPRAGPGTPNFPHTLTGKSSQMLGLVGSAALSDYEVDAPFRKDTVVGRLTQLVHRLPTMITGESPSSSSWAEENFTSRRKRTDASS